MSSVMEARNDTQPSGHTSPVHASTHYDKTTIALHWGTLLLLTAAFAAAWLTQAATTLPQVRELLQIHRSCGVAICILTMLRLGRRLLGAVVIPPLPSTLAPLQKLAARATEYTLYALLLLQPIVGLLHSFALGEPFRLFWLWVVPPLLPIAPSLSDPLRVTHEAAAIAIILLVGVHAAAALYHHYFLRDAVLRSMQLFGGSPSGVGISAEGSSM
jgi:cytochrome b561